MVNNKLLTLVFIQEGQRLLLGLKKRGFGAGKWNGFGGKVQSGETIVEGAKRELLEESCLTADTLDKIGLLMFEFVGEPQLMEVHVFSCRKYSGIPEETEEMKPQWYNTDNIPFSQMWLDDQLWIPMMLQGKMFSGYFKFEGHDKILGQTLLEVEDIFCAKPITS